MENPQYLVIGTAITETITHLEDGKSRQDVGAVAGQMATALARHQCDVTLLTSTGQDEQGKKTLERLTEAGVKTYTVTHTGKTGWARINTKAGEQARAQGAWPTLDEIASELAGNLRDIDWILVDCNLSATALNRILGMAAKEQIPVTINATTKGKSRLIWETRTHPKRLATMNRDEQLNLMRLSGSKTVPELRENLKSRNVFVSSGPQGWTVDGAKGIQASSPAIPTPAGTDYIGCGDYATAGLTHAITAGLPIVETVNRFIETRLQLNTI